MSLPNENTLDTDSLLTLGALARILHRSPAGLRISMYSGTEFAVALRRARVKLGRRVYFRRDLINRLIADRTGT